MSHEPPAVSSSELKSCPFCAGDAPMVRKVLRDGYADYKDDPDAYAYTIVCHACAAEGGWAKSESGACRWWNRRAALSGEPAPTVSQEAPKNHALLSPEMREVIARIDFDVRDSDAPPLSIFDLLRMTPGQGVDLVGAMREAMFGDGYLLSRHRRQLALALARALSALSGGIPRTDSEEASACECLDKTHPEFCHSGPAHRGWCDMYAMTTDPARSVISSESTISDDDEDIRQIYRGVEGQELTWRDCSAAVPVVIERREEWAREMLKNPQILMSRTGDSAMICVIGDMDDASLYDVLVRRVAHFRVERIDRLQRVPSPKGSEEGKR